MTDRAYLVKRLLEPCYRTYGGNTACGNDGFQCIRCKERQKAAELIKQMVKEVNALAAVADNRYEMLAACFYRETGITAPGKDIPAAVGEMNSFDKRVEAWGTWINGLSVAPPPPEQENSDG